MRAIHALQIERALDFVLDAATIDDPGRFIRQAVDGPSRLAPCELTTLSIGDLVAGTRRVVSFPEAALSPSDQASFNRLIHGHPLVHYHSHHPIGGSWRVSDSLTLPAFQRTPIGSDRERAQLLGLSPRTVQKQHAEPRSSCCVSPPAVLISRLAAHPRAGWPPPDSRLRLRSCAAPCPHHCAL